MNETPAWPTLSEATSVWARIGLLSFGGPAGQIALMHKILVDEKRWISESRFLHALNYCMLLPGPEAQQLATYIGWLLHGTRGGIIAGTLFVLPGFCVILGLSALYAGFHDLALLQSIFFGLKAAVLAIVIQAVIRVGKRSLKNRSLMALAVLAFLALFIFNLPFPIVILVAGVVGYVGTRVNPQIFAGFSGHGGKSVPDQPSVIDANMTNVRPTALRAVKVLTAWGFLWVAPLLLIVPFLGWSNIYVDIFGFFSRMAVVTFGGAYAVLSYVAQAAVDSWHWLKPGEMLDGLALAETTPGPLVLVLSYVGFLAAYRNPLGLDPFLAGALGATLTTWVTFIPCFLWIFLGAPYVEILRSNKALSGALTALSAAVVGVIANLALWFALHVLFSQVGDVAFGSLSITLPVLSSIRLWSAALSILAVILIFKAKLNVLAVLAICAASGVLIDWML